MPTKKPRVNVTVTSEQHALLLELASLQGTSASAILRQMLDQVTPLLRASVPLLRTAARETEITVQRAQELLKAPLEQLAELGALPQLDLLDPPAAAVRTERSEGGRGSGRSRKSGRG